MSSVTGSIANNKITVALGDMTKVKADAFIVPQFTSDASFGGVGGAVARGGAEGGMSAYQDYVDKNGTQDFGQVLLTPSYGGNSKYLLHAVSVGSGAEVEFETVKTAMFNALRLAENNGLSSIVAPAMGTGIIGRLTDTQSAKAMMSAIHDYASAGGKAMDVSFVLYAGQETLKAFDDVLKSGSYKDVKAEMGGRDIDLLRWHFAMNADADANSRHEKKAMETPTVTRKFTTMKQIKPVRK